MKNAEDSSEIKFAGASFNVSPLLEDLPIPTIPKGYKLCYKPFFFPDMLIRTTPKTKE